MDGLEFSSSLIKSLAWPVVALVIVLILRKPIAHLFSDRGVKRVKAGPGGIEIEYWDEKLREAAEMAAVPEESPVPPSGPAREIIVNDDFMGEMLQLARIAPSAAVVESFARLERVLREAVERLPVPEGERSTYRSVRSLARLAARHGLLTDAQLAAFDDVATLRNAAAHGGQFDLDAARAIAYADVVKQLIIAISLSQGRAARDGDL